MRTSSLLKSVATMAKERIDALTAQASKATIERLESEVAMLRDRCDVMQKHHDDLEANLSAAMRAKQEFFELIERIEKQRDEWREMFKRAAMEQMTALNIVDRALARERRVNATLLRMLNDRLKKEGQEPLDEKRLPDEAAAPAGEYKRYAESMMRLFNGGVPEAAGRPSTEPRPPDIDGVAERDGALT